MKQSSFNAFGQKREGFGGRHIPVWLGTVTPYPVGGSLAKAYVKAGLLLPAGTPIQLKDRVITPALVYTVKAYASEVLTIDPSEHPGFTPGKDMYVRLVGDTFPADDGVKVTDAAANAATPSQLDLTATVACISNIGPGLSLVGPNGNFAMFSWFSKLVLIFDMLIGRLEIYPILLLCSPSFWRRNG